MTLKYKNMQKTSEQGAGINDVTRISKGATINGDLISSSDIRVDGVINGKVLSDGKIVVGEQAGLSGSLFCTNLDFWGKMEGDIYVKDTLCIKSTATVNGNIHVNKLQVEMGAQINGTCKMISEQEYEDLASKVNVKRGKTVLVTGAAGFIGSNLVKRLLSDISDITVIGIDSITDYYDVNIKYGRLSEIEECSRKTGGKWSFIKASIADKDVVDAIFESHRISVVVNLAAQAGVRYSITNPDAYIESNIIGFFNILEACRHHEVEHLVYASSSSVYGSNKKVPYSTDDKVDNPVSLYAATKKSNELMAHAYSKLYNIPSTGLRFFTVYWHISGSRISSAPVKLSKYSITGTANGILPILTISWRALCG